MTNWKNIHLDFTAELQTRWEKKGFNYQECQKWINIGLTPLDYEYAYWLINIKQLTSEWVLNNGNNYQLRQEYKWQQQILEQWNKRGFNEGEARTWLSIGIHPENTDFAKYLKEKYQTPAESLKHGDINQALWQEYSNHSHWQWKEIHPDFTTSSITLPNRTQIPLWLWWIRQGFTQQSAQQWITVGVNPKELELITYLQVKGYQSLASDSEKIRKDYQTKQWLDKNCPKETKSKVKTIFINEQLTGELDLADFIELEKIYISLSVDANKLNLKNQPKKAEIIKSVNESVNAQEYINQRYPTEEDKINCQLLNIGVKNEDNLNGIEENLLEGSLSLKGFTNLRALLCGKQQITDLDLSDCSQLEKLQCWGNKLTNLDLSNCQQLKEFGCGSNKLTNLDLNKFPNLTMLKCSENQLSTLDLTNCPELIEIWCSKNKLEQLILPPDQLDNLQKLVCWDNLLTNLNFSVLNSEKLTVISLQNNNFSTRDLSCFAKFTQLKELYLGTIDQTKINQGIYDHWVGSLEYLKDLTQLEKLNISNTDINQGIEYLPEGLEKITYSSNQKPDCQLTTIINQLTEHEWKDIHLDFTLKLRKEWEKIGLEKEQIKEWIEAGFKHYDIKFISYLRDVKKLTSEEYLKNKDKINYQELKKSCNDYDWCRNCQQINTNTNWCQPCAYQEWKQNFNQLTDQEIIEKFIQNQPVHKKLELIPHEQFTNIEYLTEGGFGKVYKAQWNIKKVALKSLVNSQNNVVNFLQEVDYHRLFSDIYQIVSCYGISQDPITKNYIMVMQYIEGGNLHQYLQHNYSKLNFKDKISQLMDIVKGLNSIHSKKLIHQDFHSGNILNHGYNYITDLGLCRPTNETNSGNIYGVLPYVAPEVLCGKPYTQASDIYSFGIIAYEILTGLPPYYNLPHGTNLTIKICQGLRPKFDIKIPSLLEELIKQCWDAELLSRPKTSKINKILEDWYLEINYNKDTEFVQQYLETEQYNKILPDHIKFPKCKPHPQAIYTSRLINTKQIIQSLSQHHSRNLDTKDFPEPQNSQIINDEFYNLKDNFQNKTLELNTQLIKVKKLAKEINANEKQKSSWETKAEQKYNDFKKALKLVFEKSDELEEIITNNRLIISEEMKELLKSKVIEFKELKARVNELETKGKDAYQILKESKTKKEKELEELKNTIIYNNQLEDEIDLGELTELLEKKETAIENNNKDSIKKLELVKKRILRAKTISEEEINSLCRCQEEITKLKLELQSNLDQQEKQVTQIINSIKVDNVIVHNGSAVISNQIGNDASFSYKNIEELANKELVTRTKRQLSFSAEFPKETKSIKLDQVYQSEPMEIDNNNRINIHSDNNDWTNIHSSFTSQLVQSWIEQGFTYQECTEWINIGLTPADYEFAYWLKNIKKLTSEVMLNQGNKTELRQEFKLYKTQLQARVEQPPKQCLIN